MSSVKARALVTGGAGFIGSHLTDILLERGYAVTVLDDFSSGSRENLESASRSGQLRIIEGSVLDPEALKEAVQGCSYVFHLAVQCVRRSLGRPLENHETNATGTILTLEAARRANVHRFVYCSSSEVYGNCGGERLNEETTHCAPVTVYGAAKLAGEYYAKAYFQTYGLPIVIVRPFNSYGPREHDQGELAEVIPRFVIRVLNGERPIIFGTGQNARDFTYVTESAAGIALAAECDALVGGIVNIAFGRMVTIGALAQMICRLCGRPDLAPLYTDPRPGDVFTLQADITRARNLLRYVPRIDIESGLRLYLAWFRAKYADPSLLLELNPRNWDMPT